MGLKQLRVVEIGEKRHTMILADRPGPGGVSHQYFIGKDEEGGVSAEFGSIIFQNGGIKQVGVNGATNEDLIAIVIDRLRGLQKSEFSCWGNYCALCNLETALSYLESRTAEREKRGVEGELIP